ncbi:MAG: efflux RND transporter permease subunit [Candidatus Eisenbacteria bacterium]|nr:efflux RND transporter permease subunit [Candidatus Eisenbacteria bacterium]
MLNRLIAWSLANRGMVLVLAGLLLVAGTWTATRTPVDIFPDLTAPTVTIIVEASGMAPEEIETVVTFPLESAVNGAPDVRRVRSSTVTGISVVWVEFEWGVDIFRARQAVLERIQGVASAFPPGVDEPILAPISSIMGEILMVGLGGTASPEDLRSVATWEVRPRLLAMPGVAQVIPIGGHVREYQVLIDPVRMGAAGVTLDEVLRAAGEAGVNSSGGVVVSKGQEYLVRTLGQVRGTGDIAGTVVAVRNGVPLRLGDVAEVMIGPAPRFGDGSVNGKPGVVLAVQKQPGANTLALTRDIDQALEEIRSRLPPGMTLHTDLFRQSSFIERAIENVVEALRDGALLVIAVLAVFLWNLRATAISVLAIPLSLSAAFLVLHVLGLTLNTMSLGGLAIAIGALVDDAIIDVENVDRRLRENRRLPVSDQRPVMTVVYDASREIRASIVNATAIIIVVFLPLFFLGGVEGRLLKPLGVAYIVALLASLLVAVTVTPALASWWLVGRKDAPPRGDSAVVTALKSVYRRQLAWVLARPRRVILGAGVALIGALAVLPFLGSSFLPEFNEGALTISVVTVPGTSLDEANRIGLRVESMLLAHPEVAATDRRQGRAELDEHAQGVNAGEIDARLHDGVDRDELLATLREEFTSLPGTNITIGQPIGHRIDHMLSGTRASIAVKLFGPDRQELRRIGTLIVEAMRDVPGLVDLQLEPQVDIPQIQITPDRPTLAQYGLTVGDLSGKISTMVRGEAVATILEEGRPLDLVVRLAEAGQHSPESLKALLIDTPTGARVRLDRLAQVRVDRGANAISRENARRKIVIQANVAGRDLGGAVAETQRLIKQSVPLPTGYHLEYAGQFESQIAAARRLGILSILSVAAIFIILFSEFRSARIAAVVMVNLPLALIGGILAVLATDRIVSVASLVGFVTLFGIATRNGILMISHFRHLEAEGVPRSDAIFQGSLERLSPILMTALTAGLALVPLALSGGEPGNEIQTPMAVVILGGLVTSTALNMVVVPALYALFGDRERERSGQDPMRR